MGIIPGFVGQPPVQPALPQAPVQPPPAQQNQNGIEAPEPPARRRTEAHLQFGCSKTRNQDTVTFRGNLLSRLQQQLPPVIAQAQPAQAAPVQNQPPVVLPVPAQQVAAANALAQAQQDAAAAVAANAGQQPALPAVPPQFGKRSLVQNSALNAFKKC